ncbi:MAG: helix-turn-helix transcriptional regulator [Clostridia bacterium]|nr:helix-turn-helix transcriptional regulator [Clostridia bacterium]
MFSVNNNDIKERVCDYRKTFNTTQQDLAIFLGIKRASYRAKEADGNFDWDEIVQIADYFNVSPFFIRYGAEDEDFKVIAKILKEHGPFMHRLREPNVSIYDDLEKYQEETQIYASFLNLDQAEQTRIVKQIENLGL